MAEWQSLKAPPVITGLQLQCITFVIFHTFFALQQGQRGWSQMLIPLAGCTNWLLLISHNTTSRQTQNSPLIASERHDGRGWRPRHIHVSLWKTGLRCPLGWCVHTHTQLSGGDTISGQPAVAKPPITLSSWVAVESNYCCKSYCATQSDLLSTTTDLHKSVKAWTQERSEKQSVLSCKHCSPYLM